jgi:hypothetical protein
MVLVWTIYDVLNKRTGNTVGPKHGAIEDHKTLTHTLTHTHTHTNRTTDIMLSVPTHFVVAGRSST